MTTNDNPAPENPAGAAGSGGTDGTAPPPPAPPCRPAGEDFFDSVRRIGVARADDRWVGGVAAGIADRFRLDPLLVRGLLILSFFVAGAGLVLYGLAWALLPERSDGRIHLQEAIRGNYDVALVGATTAVVLGLVGFGGFWPWWIGPTEWISVLLWIAFWVAVVWLLVKLVRSRGRTDAPPAPTTPPPAPASDSTHPSEPFTPAPRAHYAPAAPPADAVTAVVPPAPAGVPTTGVPVMATATQTAATPPRPQQAPPAPQVPQPRRYAGAGTVGAVFGLALLAAAALLVLDRTMTLDVPVWPTWVGAAVVAIGAGIVVTGLRGLRGGWLTAFAWGGLFTVLLTWPFTDVDGNWGWDGDVVTTMSGTAITSGTVTPRTLAAAEEGVRVQFGEGFIDLTELDLTGVRPGEPVVVPVEMTAGRAVIEIPADTAVSISADVNAGNLVVDIDNERMTTSGFSGGPSMYETEEVAELGGAVLQLDVNARAGEIVIQEER